MVHNVPRRHVLPLRAHTERERERELEREREREVRRRQTSLYKMTGKMRLNLWAWHAIQPHCKVRETERKGHAQRQTDRQADRQAERH